MHIQNTVHNQANLKKPQCTVSIYYSIVAVQCYCTQGITIHAVKKNVLMHIAEVSKHPRAKHTKKNFGITDVFIGRKKNEDHHHFP